MALSNIIYCVGAILAMLNLFFILGGCRAIDEAWIRIRFHEPISSRIWKDSLLATAYESVFTFMATLGVLYVQNETMQVTCILIATSCGIATVTGIVTAFAISVKKILVRFRPHAAG